MSSPSNAFECRWHASRQLLAVYLLAQLFALGSLFLLSIPIWASVLGIFACLAHGAGTLPRKILLTHPKAFMGLRRDADGWQLWNKACGWRPVQLRPDSLALPLMVVLLNLVLLSLLILTAKMVHSYVQLLLVVLPQLLIL